MRPSTAFALALTLALSPAALAQEEVPQPEPVEAIEATAPGAESEESAEDALPEGLVPEGMDMEEAMAAAMAAFEEQLEYRTGVLELGGGLAQLDTGEGFRYLDPDDTQTLLEDGWGNPYGAGTLGMLIPVGVSPLADEGWGIIVSFEEDGYVKDDDAADIDYDELLSSMKASTADENTERVEMGYPAIELVGWATPPHYDSMEKKLYWAKELKFGDEPDTTLNYNIRMLGRRGVLVLNAVGSMAQLEEIETATPTVLASLNFNEGHRYADFDPEIDKVAAYGIGALIAGKVAAKAGFFKAILAALVAGKKFVIIAVVAIGGLLARMANGPKQKTGA